MTDVLSNLNGKSLCLLQNSYMSICDVANKKKNVKVWFVQLIRWFYVITLNSPSDKLCFLILLVDVWL